MIPLNEQDLSRLESQGWQKHSDYSGTRIVVRQSLWSRKRVLAKRSDGSCIFLTEDGRCRIHLEHGLKAKPSVCQLYPLQVVPHGNAAFLTLRRSCPSAAAGRGREFDEKRPDVKRLLKQQKQRLSSPRVPRLTRRIRLDWKDIEVFLHAISQFMNDGRYPVVRRLVHMLLFCDTLEQCDVRRLSAGEREELVGLLEAAALEQASPYFSERKPPSRAAAGLLRQSAFQFLRLHPTIHLQESIRDRLRLSGAGLSFLLGRGCVPSLGGTTENVPFEDLDRPLGPLPVEVAQPLNLFLETAAASGRYALLYPPRWTVVDGARNLALAYVVAMWLARLFSHGEDVTRDTMVDIVIALDRGQGFEPLTGARHRRRVRGISLSGEFPILVARYAR